MTKDLKEKALDILSRCTVEKNRVKLPEEEIDHEVWSIVKDALTEVGGKYMPTTKDFRFNPYSNQLLTATEWLRSQEVISYEAPALYNGPEEVEAEEEEIKEEKAKPKQFVKEKRTLRYDFTADEVYELAMLNAQDIAKLESVEKEKSQQTAHYGAIIKEIKARLNKNSILITNGFENRDVDCEIYYNSPEPGKKTIIRLDTNKATVERMEYYEFNLFTQPVNEEEESFAEEDV